MDRFIIAYVLFVHVTLTVTGWPWHTNLIYTFWRCIPEKKFLCQGCQELEHEQDTDVTERISNPHWRLVGDINAMNVMQWVTTRHGIIQAEQTGCLLLFGLRSIHSLRPVDNNDYFSRTHDSNIAVRSGPVWRSIASMYYVYSTKSQQPLIKLTGLRPVQRCYFRQPKLELQWKLTPQMKCCVLLCNSVALSDK